MADFVAVLNKTIDGLGERNTPEMRQKVYERAKKAVTDKLAAITPAPTAAQSARQFALLDEAIASVEASYVPVIVVPPKPVVAPQSDPLADFLASVDQDVPTPATPSSAPSLDAIIAKAPEMPKPVEALVAKTSSIDDELGLNKNEPIALPGSDMLRKPAKKKGASGLVFGLLGLLVIGGAGYAGYVYKDQIQTYLGNAMNKPAAKVEPAKTPDPAPQVAVAEPAQEVAPEPVQEPATPAAPEEEVAAAKPETVKLTQRLNADGTEIEAGPGAKPQDVGEGESVAVATTPSTDEPAAPQDPAVTPEAGAEVAPAPATPAAPQEATIAVGQKAIFYEEKTGTQQGTADQGAVVWSVVQDSPGLDLPPEPAIRGEISVPDKSLNVRLTIKRNLDKTLPASHLVEMLFTTPPEFSGGIIEDVQRFAMKDTEQAPGNPLVGVPANLGDGFFLIALTDEKTAVDANLALLGKQQWIDVPVAYGSGRRALLSFEKGIPGDRVFQEVLKAWEAKKAN